MQSRQRRNFRLPGTKVVKQARASTAQKSSHQNIRFWIRRPIRATVISPDTRKKAKEATAVYEDQCMRISKSGATAEEWDTDI